jgi:pimeloyl-ACP methyl ester carboxylesterase
MPTLRSAKKGAFLMLKVLVGLVVLGASFNAWRDVVDAKRFPPPGTLIAVGDHRLHMYCTGQGQPTVVLEAGSGMWSFYYGRLQRALSDSVRVCSYDRAGMGWSERGSGQFDIATSAAELRLLLREAKEAQPVVLVGHSLGANIAIYYAANFPDELAGAVLVDPGVPADWVDDYKGTDDDARRINGCGWKCGAMAGAANLGLGRLSARIAGAGSKTLSEPEVAQYRAGLAHARTMSATMGVLMFLPKSAVEAREARQFGNVPMTVIYSADTRKAQGRETANDVAAWHAATLDSMRVLLQGTTHPRGPIVVPGVTHTTVALDSGSVRIIAGETMRLVHLQRDKTP